MAAPQLIGPDTANLDARAMGRHLANEILNHPRLKETLDNYNPFPTDVIVVKWIREKIGTGKLMAAPQTQNEDRWQCKCGLILKLGSHAFQDEGELQFHGWRANVGDWVQFRASEGDEFGIVPVGSLQQFESKRLWHGHISAVLTHPDQIY